MVYMEMMRRAFTSLPFWIAVVIVTGLILGNAGVPEQITNNFENAAQDKVSEIINTDNFTRAITGK